MSDDNMMVNATGTNATASSSTLGSAGAGISGGYEGDSLTLRVLIVFFPALAMYNVVELVILIFCTFSKWRGLYFWSLLISSLGIVPYSLGFLFKFNNITTGNLRWLSVVLLTIGWYTMVTGQAVVLWSRLHLIVQGTKGERTLRWTKWMIIINVICLHIPTSVLTFGSNGTINTEVFVRGYSIMEKIQMSGFFIQEVILSTIYIVATLKILRTSIRDDTRRMMYQLFAINVLIIIMDLALLGLEAASLYILETITKGVFYSIKLKLEFAILGRLVQFVGGHNASISNEERNRKASVTFFGEGADEKRSRSSSGRTGQTIVPQFSQGDPPDFVDMSCLQMDMTRAASDTPTNGQASNLYTDGDARKRTRGSSVTRLRPGMSNVDVDIALFEHADDVSLPPISPGGIESQAEQNDTVRKRHERFRGPFSTLDMTTSHQSDHVCTGQGGQETGKTKMYTK